MRWPVCSNNINKIRQRAPPRSVSQKRIQASMSSGIHSCVLLGFSARIRPATGLSFAPPRAIAREKMFNHTLREMRRRASVPGDLFKVLDQYPAGDAFKRDSSEVAFYQPQ